MTNTARIYHEKFYLTKSIYALKIIFSVSKHGKTISLDGYMKPLTKNASK